MPGPFYVCSFIAGAGLALVLSITWHDVIRMSREMREFNQLAAGVLRAGQIVAALISLSMMITGIWGAAYG